MNIAGRLLCLVLCAALLVPLAVPGFAEDYPEIEEVELEEAPAEVPEIPEVEPEEAPDTAPEEIDELQEEQLGVYSPANESAVFEYIRFTMGANLATTLGILANIKRESNFDPSAQCIDTNGLTSYGICQWNGSRFTALRNYCGENYVTIQGQLDYLYHELQTSERSAWSRMQGIADNAEGAYLAGYRWAQYFERCAHYYNGRDQYADRAKLARDTFWVTYVGPAQVPGDVRANVNGSTVTLSWSSAYGATTYDAYLIVSPWNWSDIRYSAAVTGTQATFTGVAAGDYRAFVIARPNPDTTQSAWVAVNVGQAPSHNHIYSSRLSRSPSLTAAGELTCTCTGCGFVTTVTLPALNKTDYTYTVVTAPTETAAGTARYVWKVTDYGNYQFEVPIPAGTQLPLSIISITLTNNQSIRVRFNRDDRTAAEASRYRITGAEEASVSGASRVESGVYQLNFSQPLKAGNYLLRFQSDEAVTAGFTISLDLSVYRVVDARNVIIRLSDAIIGCTTAANYSFHALDGSPVRITRAVSAYAELGSAVPDVFRLTTDRDLAPGTTYVVETKAMSRNGQPCQGTIAYFTTDAAPVPSTGTLEITALTNNQSIRLRLPRETDGADSTAGYTVRSSSGAQIPLGNVRSLGNLEYELNFRDPLSAGHYTVSIQGLSGSFDITLDLKVIRVENSSVIIQLNEPIYGCTTPANYFIHKLGAAQEITAVFAESVFTELGGTMPNVFRIWLPQPLVKGQTYIIETRAMSLDREGTRPCQGTIGYFTK